MVIRKKYRALFWFSPPSKILSTLINEVILTLPRWNFMIPCVFFLCLVAPLISHLLVSTTWCDTRPLRVERNCDLLLNNKIRKAWWIVTSFIRLLYTAKWRDLADVIKVLDGLVLSSSERRSPGWAWINQVIALSGGSEARVSIDGFEEVSCHVVRGTIEWAMWQGTAGIF